MKQHPLNFQIQPNFNVDTTLKIDVESTLIQRCCVCWVPSVALVHFGTSCMANWLNAYLTRPVLVFQSLIVYRYLLTFGSKGHMEPNSTVLYSSKVSLKISQIVTVWPNKNPSGFYRGSPLTVSFILDCNKGHCWVFTIRNVRLVWYTRDKRTRICVLNSLYKLLEDWLYQKAMKPVLKGRNAPLDKTFKLSQLSLNLLTLNSIGVLLDSW